jgi:hypothetical protein
MIIESMALWKNLLQESMAPYHKIESQKIEKKNIEIK